MKRRVSRSAHPRRVSRTLLFSLTTFLGVAQIALASAANPSPAPSGGDLADMSLEQLMKVHVERVYGASKYEQRVTQAPASVTIVTADEIAAFGDRTLSDVLRGVRGLYVSNDRNYSYLGVRGFLRPGDYNTRTLVLVDGHRMNENVYDGALLDQESMIDVDLIDRVEVIRGPSSSIYGSSAFFGVINLITKSGKSVNGTEVSTRVGDDGTYSARYTYGGVIGKNLEVLISTTYYSSQGEGTLYYPEFDQRISANPAAANNGVAIDSDGEHAYQLFTDIRYNDLTLTAFGSSGTKNIPTGSFGAAFNTRGEYTSDQRWYLDFKYSHSFDDEGNLLIRAFWDDAHYFGFYPTNYAEPTEAPDVVLNRDVADGRWAGLEAQFTRSLGERQTLLVGAEYRRDLHETQRNYDETIPRVYYVDDNRDGHELGLYAQDEYKASSLLSFHGGLRFDDYFASGQHALSPRFGAILTPRKETVLKFLYGDAFRAPNAYEQAYLQDGENLRPEKIRTYEFVFEQYFQPNYKASLSAYYYRVADLIDIGGDDSAFQTVSNHSRVTAKGIESEFEASFENGMMARASLNLQDTDDSSTGVELTNAPTYLGKLALLAPLWRGAKAGLEVQYYGSMDTLSGSSSHDFILTNLTLTQKELIPRLNLAVSVYNLFDTDYAYPGSTDHTQSVIPQNGRGFRVKLDFKF